MRIDMLDRYDDTIWEQLKEGVETNSAPSQSARLSI